MNKAKVDVGQSPPLDLVSAQAEVAADQEQLIIAETTVKQAEDRLRLLIFDPTDRDDLERGARAGRLAARRHGGADVDAAVTTRARASAPTCSARARTSRTRRRHVKFTQQPEAARRAPERELSGERPRRHAGAARPAAFPARSSARATSRRSASCSISCSRSDYPTWTVGVSVSYPLGESAEEANYARAKLERAQADERLKSAEGTRRSSRCATRRGRSR